MLPPSLTSRWIRELDRRAVADYSMNSLVLMENAARSVCDILQMLNCQGPIGIACGKGNNGGDGFAIARLLDGRGHRVRVLLFAEPEKLTGDAALNWHILHSASIPVWIAPATVNVSDIYQAAEQPEWVLDCLLGTGTQGAPRFPLDIAIRALNQLPARKLAVDLPSGLHADSGEASNDTFRAEHTVTFVAPKPGLLALPAADYVGTLHVGEIGVPRKLIREIYQSAAAESRTI